MVLSVAMQIAIKSGSEKAQKARERVPESPVTAPMCTQSIPRLPDPHTRCHSPDLSWEQLGQLPTDICFEKESNQGALTELGRRIRRIKAKRRMARKKEQMHLVIHILCV